MKYDLFEIGLRDKLAFSTVNITFWTSNTNNQLNRIYLTSVNDAKTMNLLKTAVGEPMLTSNKRSVISPSKNHIHGSEDVLIITIMAASFWKNGKNTIDYTKSGLTKVPEHSVKLKVKYDFTDDLSGDIQYTYYGSYNNFLSDANKEEDGVANHVNSLTSVFVTRRLNTSNYMAGSLT
ncbi:hypothetical protein J4727_16845 [Providencia rettgeri]|uniref:Uncharacterized protein n=1 Tax=Providencia rettgeri TaxID=587 RepID=A0A939NKU8_PRORE|nr:hypothetical protein [Providencia rettgeri]